MSFANIVGALLQQGMSGQSRSRLERTVGPQGLGGAGGGGIEQMLGSLLGGLGGGSAAGGAAGGAGAGGLGSLVGLAEAFLGSKQAGNLTGGQLGGLGAIAGALLGGGGKSVKGALGGSAMAILGALAVNALQGRLGGAGGGGATAAAEAPGLSSEQLESLADPATERLIVRAMIAAAKADGQVDEREMERIAGKIGTDGITPEERQMVLEELRLPLDLDSLVADVQSQIVAAEVYGASLLAIDVDTDAEVAYLGQLARALRLDSTTVARLHELTGAPTQR